MSSNQDILQEEFEVLEAIYPDELEKISDTEIQISVAPEEQIPNEELRLLLHVDYPPEYPDVIPTLSLTAEEGEMGESEEETLLEIIKTSAKESIGMAQTFSMVTALIEAISNVVSSRVKQKEDAKAKKEQEIEEAELKRIRGTPVTPDSFLAWRAKFTKEMAISKQTKEEDHMKNVSNKEREEYKRYAGRLTGRQLFERNKDLAMSDDTLVEEGAESVDITKYSRDEAMEDEPKDEQERLYFSDSD